MTTFKHSRPDTAAREGIEHSDGLDALRVETIFLQLRYGLRSGIIFSPSLEKFRDHAYSPAGELRDPASRPSRSGLAKLRFARFSPDSRFRVLAKHRSVSPKRAAHTTKVVCSPFYFASLWGLWLGQILLLQRSGIVLGHKSILFRRTKSLATPTRYFCLLTEIYLRLTKTIIAHDEGRVLSALLLELMGVMHFTDLIRATLGNRLSAFHHETATFFAQTSCGAGFYRVFTLRVA